ncbi:SurA N-terminal domain-containing protein [Loktanella sp. F6476L]|uniref:peptidylprolyl isomerase n=1 Tax=Loktanella sp. F6476L TaxID=2926405 RepID=UPI001FF1A161|nr:peptidylprolyl isomerase [Loktanella sp. F6476L]MCK0119729.1 SurA N-terminal domain-containing protein [Loktanella sp. F6476L]
MAKSKAKQSAAWVIVVLLLIGLLGFGAGGLSGTIRSIGTVGDKSIPVVQYQRALNEQIRAFEAQVGTPVSFVQAQAIGLDQQVLNGVIAERTLDNEAAKLGLSVGDERVREEVLRVPGFRGLDGGFDREAYRSSLQRNGMTEAEFETSIREEAARTLLQGAIVDGVEAPQAYADTLARYIGEQRSITWATLTADDLTQPVPGPTDADIQTFYDENPDQFTAPETRAITYAWLTPDMIQDDVTVDATAVRQLYDDRIAQYVRPERRLVERLVYLDQTEADAAIAAITAEETTFEDLVAERGLALTDVDMGDVDENDLGAAGEAVFATNPGDIVGPFETDFGPALFRMNAVLAADETTFDEAEPELRAELAASRARRVIDDSREGINDLLAGGARLEDLADQTDLRIATIDWSTENRDDIAAYDSFRNAAATVAEGDFPDLFELEDGGIFTLRLDGITPPALRPLADVKDAAADAWQVARTQQAVLEEAEAVAAELTATAGFETVALVATSEENLTRRSFVEGTPPGFIQRVFEMETGEVITIDAGTFAAIVRLETQSVPAADDETLTADRDVFANSASAGIAQDIFEVFNAEIQRDTDVAINPAAVTAVHTSFQ